MTEYKPDTEEAIERFRQQCDAAADALVQFMREIGALFGPVFQAFDEAARTMYAGFWEDYLAGGAPYDRTEEGFARWLDELTGKAEIEAAIEEAQEREEHRCWLKRLARRFRKTEDQNGAAQTD